MVSIPGIKNCYLISRTHFTPRGKSISDDKVKYSPNKIIARIKNVSISVSLDYASSAVKTTKKMTGTLLVANKEYNLQTNDRIELGNEIFIISSFLPSNKINTLGNIRKYKIEAIS